MSRRLGFIRILMLCKYNRCNKARLSPVRSYSMGHNVHGINLYGCSSESYDNLHAAYHSCNLLTWECDFNNYPYMMRLGYL